MVDFVKEPNMPSSSTEQKKVVISNIRDFQKLVKFADKDVSYLVNRIISTLDTAEYFSNADIINMLRFLLGASIEIAIQYNPTPSHSLIRVVPGDVVSCKFGTHVDGEISGLRVHSIVCDVQDDGSVYLLPITKDILDGDARKYMLMRTPYDVSYFDPRFTGGTVLLRMGKYVRPERITIIVGKTSPEFFRTVLCAFHDSMNFLCNAPEETLFLCSGVNALPDDNALDSVLASPSGVLQEIGETTEESCSATGSTSVPKKKSSKKITFEEYLQNLFSPTFDNINDPDFSFEGKVGLFINEVGFEDKLAIVHDAFAVSCEVPRVTMQSILAALHKIHRTIDKETLKSALTVSYEQWLRDHPDIQQAYPNTSIITMFKVFAKKMK